MKPKNPVNIIRNVITYITVFIAIGYVIYLTFNSDKCTTNEYMILLLLTLIATTFVLELLDDERKWKEIKKDVHTEISAVSNSVIWKYEKTSDWVAKIKDLMSGGFHTFDSAALDKATRSKAKPQYSSIWGLLNDCSADSNITFRHVLRIRKNNLERLLKRISEGSAQKNSYFSVYELPSEFSFPTFGIIDSRYICTRSPYEQEKARAT